MPIDTKIWKGYVEGPYGVPMKEATAKAVETLLKDAPKGKEFEYRRVAKSPSSFELKEGERSDVSTVTTDAVDHVREVVLPSGIDVKQFDGVVPFAHIYDALPVGRCMWMKSSDDGHGLIAKTQYTTKPADWGADWFPDAVLHMIQEGTCRGKSIGFVPLSYREPTVEEIKARPEMGQQRVWVIDKSVLLEYSVAPVPCNSEATMIAVSKGVGGEDELFKQIVASAKAMMKGKSAADVEAVSFVTLKSVREQILKVAPSPERVKRIVEETIVDALDRAMGRV